MSQQTTEALIAAVNHAAAGDDKIPWAKPDFWGKEQEYLVQALSSTWISGGAFVERFERDFAAYVGARYALTSSNGTTALHMAYLGLGVGPGDEVVIPGFCFLAGANVAIHMGAKPVFCEVDPRTWCATAEAIERVLTPRTKVIVPVHTYGNVCRMDEINALAKSRGVAVIEDAAESFASTYRGTQAGMMSDIGSFSFQATKTITTGEGGMVVTEREDLQKTMALYRSHGMLRKRFYWHEVPGHNFRLTNLHAAIGCAQLERLDRIIVERRRVHEHYRARLEGLGGVTLQYFEPEVEPVLWAIALEVDEAAFPQGRDAIMGEMMAAGIETRNGFYAASMLTHLYETGPLRTSEQLARTVLSLPTYPTLTNDQIDRICDRLASLRR